MAVCSKCHRNHTNGVELTTPDKTKLTICNACCAVALNELLTGLSKATIQAWLDRFLSSPKKK